MLKKIGIAAILLVAGVGIAMYMRGGSTPAKEEPAQAFTPRTGASESERIADLERTLASVVDSKNLLESRVKELEGRFGNRGGGPPRRNGENNNDDQEREQRMAEVRRQMGDILDANGNIDQAKLREREREQRLERLVRAGLTRERAEWVERRQQELQLQAEQARFDAQRTGQPVRAVDINDTLRKEMGDAEYEKYLAGTGRTTQVQISDVLASSPAERAGLRPGDQIVSYAGTRVFSTGDLNSLTRQGTPGESVTVEVRRNGQTVQVTVPRGVLGVDANGIGGGRGGGRGGPPDGGPGGWGGGRPGGGGGGRPGGPG